MGKAVNQWAIKGERPLLAVQSVIGVNQTGKRIHYYVIQEEEDTLSCHAGGRGYIIMSCRGERIHYYLPPDGGTSK